MKKLIFILIFSFHAVALFAEPLEKTVDNCFRFSVFRPNDSLWEESNGFEYLCNFWLDSNYALGIVFAYTSWDMDVVLAREINSLNSPYYFDGEANFFSIGPTFTVRGELSPNFSISCDGSIQYVLANTDVDPYGYYDYYYYDYYDYGDIEINDAVIGRVNFNLEMWINRYFAWFFSAGYQFDINKGEIRIDEPGLFLEFDDSSLRGSSLSFGMIFSF